MEYTTLGRTGCRVSRLGFGGATAGLKDYLEPFDPDADGDRDKVLAALRRALELGLNYFDTAAGYGEGRSEQIFGEALAEASPDSVFVATKVGLWNNERGSVRASLERSLVNLRRDWIDLLQIHGTVYSEEAGNRVLRPGGVLDELEALRDEGLIRFLGFTCEAQNERLYAFLKTGRFDVVQLHYNFLFQHPYDPSWQCGSFYDAEAQDMGLVTMRTMTSGTFQKWIQRVNPHNTFDYNPALLQFQLSNPLVDVALVGMRDPETVEKNVAITDDLDGRMDLEELHQRYV